MLTLTRFGLPLVLISSVALAGEPTRAPVDIGWSYYGLNGGGGVADGTLQGIEGFDFLGHHALRVFLRLRVFTSSTSGACASCGWAVPA